MEALIIYCVTTHSSILADKGTTDADQRLLTLLLNLPGAMTPHFPLLALGRNSPASMSVTLLQCILKCYFN